MNKHKHTTLFYFAAKCTGFALLVDKYPAKAEILAR